LGVCEALRRGCLFRHAAYRDLDREREIVLAKVPGITASLADQVARIVRSIRQLELKKPPSVSETLDWARTLLLLGVEQVDAAIATGTANILLKYQSDITKATKELEQDSALNGNAATAGAQACQRSGSRPAPGQRGPPQRRRGSGHRRRSPPRLVAGGRRRGAGGPPGRRG